MPTLQYNSDDLVTFTAQLKRLHKSAFPLAIRGTLNDAAFQTKKEEILKASKKSFNVRKPSFFRSQSGVVKATGWNINKMYSKAGMVKSKDPNSRASTEIAKQEFGGTINKKSYIGHEDSRTGKGLLKKSYINDMDSKPIKPSVVKKNKKQSFFIAAKKAHKENRNLLYETNGEGIVYKIKSFSKKKFKAVRLASYKKNRSVKISKKRPFITEAAKQPTKDLNKHYKINAEKQVKRVMKL